MPQGEIPFAEAAQNRILMSVLVACLQSCQHGKAHSEPPAPKLPEKQWDLETFSQSAADALEKDDQDSWQSCCVKKLAPVLARSRLSNASNPTQGAQPPRLCQLARAPAGRRFSPCLTGGNTAREIAEGYNAAPKSMKTKGYYGKETLPAAIKWSNSLILNAPTARWPLASWSDCSKSTQTTYTSPSNISLGVSSNG